MPRASIRIYLCLVTLSVVSCTTTGPVRQDPDVGPAKPAKPYETFTLWDEGTKLDKSLLRRGAKARRSGNTY